MKCFSFLLMEVKKKLRGITRAMLTACTLQAKGGWEHCKPAGHRRSGGAGDFMNETASWGRKQSSVLAYKQKTKPLLDLTNTTLMEFDEITCKPPAAMPTMFTALKHGVTFFWRVLNCTFSMPTSAFKRHRWSMLHLWKPAWSSWQKRLEGTLIEDV